MLTIEKVNDGCVLCSQCKFNVLSDIGDKTAVCAYLCKVHDSNLKDKEMKRNRFDAL